LKRVAIVDWDVHHGNGTQSIFWTDPRVLAISLHQDDLFSLRGGNVDENGEGAGKGATINIPLPPGSGHSAYIAAFERVVLPALARFRPELIIVASGLDASSHDPSGRMNLHSESYRVLTALLMQSAAQHCKGRLVLCHEGGYSAFLVPFLGLAILETLSGIRTEARDPFLPTVILQPAQALSQPQAAVIDSAAALVARVPGPESQSAEASSRASSALPGQRSFTLLEATIEEIQSAMEAGALSSVELVTLYLNRIFAYDQNGIKLNSIPVLNPNALAEAAEADRLRVQGKVLGPLHGIPFTVKDSYKVKGLTVACGSPAFAGLIANEDAFTVDRIRAAGGILLGKTNMPPMAHGGMQRGVYGRAESPYNADYLTAAWRSGSSNGSGTATAASFAAFGMGEETVSSGRSPASNNGLVAYTPSRGLISIRGNWPLYPLRDVVVPMARSMGDLFTVLDVIARPDTRTDGDFWRHQSVVKLPNVKDVRPARYPTLASRDALRGKRLGVPKMYIGKQYADRRLIPVRPSIVALWVRAAEDLRAQGAELIEVELPFVYNWENELPVAKSVTERGLYPAEWLGVEGIEDAALNPQAAEEFLASNKDLNFPSWTSIDPDEVFPTPAGAVDEEAKGVPRPFRRMIESIARGTKPVSELPKFAEALNGLEKVRKVDFEDWLIENKLDGVVFPANADVAKAESDRNEAAYDYASFTDGVRTSNTNRVLRCLGIPSVSVCMGLMADIGMPVNLTFIGPAYSDNDLLRFAYTYEQATHHRLPPPSRASVEGRDDTLQFSDCETAPSAREQSGPSADAFGTDRPTIEQCRWQAAADG
jgi:amidase